MFLSRVTYSGRVHFRLPTVALALTSLRSVRGAPGLLSRKRPTSTLWQVMSERTPPPCRCACQNHGMCGPLCSSAARQIRTATDRNGAAVHDVLAALDGAREHLVFQVTVHELGIFSEPQHLPRLGERAAERFFARDPDELRPSGLHQPMDLTHGVEPDEIRHTDPYGVDFAGNEHRLERRERPAR